MIRALPRPFSVPLVSRLTVAVVIHGALTALVALNTAEYGRPLALLAIVPPLIGLAVRDRPRIVAGLMILSGLILGVAWLGMSPTDPLENARHAFDRVLAGQNPYGGHIYPNGTAYAYGPLGLVAYLLAIPGEVLAMVGTALVLTWQRAWITLALVTTLPLSVHTAFNGANDHTPTFLLVLGLVLLKTHPRWAAFTLAVGIAVKPYAAAWALPAIGFGGLPVLAVGAAATAVLWAPVVAWGPASFLVSIRSLEAGWAATVAQGHISWSIADIPWARYLAVPIALTGFLTRSWSMALLVGAAAFTVYLGFAPWANTAHLLPLLVTVGLALEGLLGPRPLLEANPVNVSVDSVGAVLAGNVQADRRNREAGISRRNDTQPRPRQAAGAELVGDRG